MVTTPLHGWIDGDKLFEFLGFDMPALRKYVVTALPILSLRIPVWTPRPKLTPMTNLLQGRKP